MNEDNQAAIKIVSNNQITKRSKHVNIGCHFIRERFKNQDIEIHYCHTDKMAVDRYMKGLARAKFDSFLKLLGLRVLKEETAYKVEPMPRSPSSLGQPRHPLFSANSILGIPRTLSLLSAM
jgi:hypothetical protein